MTIQQFGDASHYVQEITIKLHGVFLLMKKTGSLTAFLYHLEGFYAEVTYSSAPFNTPLIQRYSVREMDA